MIFIIMNLIENILRIKEIMRIDESFTLDGILKVGSVGTDVEELQKILGIYIDGKFGPQTKKCVQKFQSDMGIEDDGVVGPITTGYIKKLEDKEVEWKTPDFCKSESSSEEIEKEKNEPSTITVKKDDGDSDIILMGGLDTRGGDLNINQQIDKVKKSSGSENVIGHRYFELSDVLNSIKNNPNSYVILFSAGCRYANDISSAMDDKNKLFIVEPYAISAGVRTSINNAVSKGVPASNVIVGPSQGRGSGVVDGATETPSGIGHWGALEYVASLLK